MHTRIRRAEISVSIDFQENRVILSCTDLDGERTVMTLNRAAAVGLGEDIISGLNQLRDASTTRTRKPPRGIHYSAPMAN